MFCHNCGTKIAEEGRFCPTCGAKVKKEVNKSNNTEAKTPVMNVKYKFKMYILMMTIIMILLNLTTPISTIKTQERSYEIYYTREVMWPNGLDGEVYAAVLYLVFAIFLISSILVCVFVFKENKVGYSVCTLLNTILAAGVMCACFVKQDMYVSVKPFGAMTCLGVLIFQNYIIHWHHHILKQAEKEGFVIQ